MTNAIQTIITGKLIAAKTATFTDDQGQPVTYGKVQVMTPDMSGDFFSIQNIKVKTENFGMLADLQEKSISKNVQLQCSTNSYNGKVSYYLEPFRA